MKKIILILLIFCFAPMAKAQKNDDDQWEKIKALKVAFFTEELDLTNKIAQKFWPVYNAYEKKRYELHERERIDPEKIKCINETEANQLLDEFLSVESEEYKLKKQFFKDMKEIISAKDIIKLQKLEDDFHRKLMKEYRNKKRDKDGNNNSE